MLYRRPLYLRVSWRAKYVSGMPLFFALLEMCGRVISSNSFASCSIMRHANPLGVVFIVSNGTQNPAISTNDLSTFLAVLASTMGVKLENDHEMVQK